MNFAELHTADQLEPTTLTDWVPPEAITEENEHIPLGTVKYSIRHREENGLLDAGAVAKVGKRYLLHRRRYPIWLATRGAVRSSRG